MSGVPAGLVTAAQVNSQPIVKDSPLASPATWAVIWFAAATVYLLGVYFNLISIRKEA
jgi:hypothetical protein